MSAQGWEAHDGLLESRQVLEMENAGDLARMRRAGLGKPRAVELQEVFMDGFEDMKVQCQDIGIGCQDVGLRTIHRGGEADSGTGARV